MKKITAVILSLLLVLVIAGGIFLSQFEKIIDWKQINDDRLTEQEELNFENQLGTKTFYYYNSLNDEQKQAYIMVYSMFQDFTESRRLEIGKDDLTTVLTAVLYDNSDLFWVALNYRYVEYEGSTEFFPVYRFYEEDARRISAELNERINEIVEASQNFDTDYEKELYFHNYVCENVVYDEESITTLGEYGDTAYSALINGKAICEGYSRAMQMLLDKAGINNYLVVGDGKTEDGTEPHMWNIVEIDGKNYHLDATWNDTSTETGYGYLYFNVTDDLISRDHLNIEPASNNCVYMNANYFVMNNLYIEDFQGFDYLAYPVAEMLKTGTNTVEILFVDETELNKAAAKLKNNNYDLFNFIEAVVDKSGRNLKTDEIEYFVTDDYNYLCLIFKEG